MVDGPWTLTRFTTPGCCEFAPNPSSSGPVRPRLAHVIEEPFTSDTAEVDALRSGQLTDGCLPDEAISQAGHLGAHGCRAGPWIAWAISCFLTNCTSPTRSPMLRQPYIRQAMQSLIDQPRDVRAISKGCADPNHGPVPLKPQSPCLTPLERDGACPHNPSHAWALLRAHGWTVRPDGISSGSRPGTAPGDGGAGIARGATLHLPVEDDRGVVSEAQLMEPMKSSFSLAGIDLELTAAPDNQAAAVGVPSDKKTGGGRSGAFTHPGSWSCAPDDDPAGGEIDGCGVGFKPGTSCDPPNQANILRTHRSTSLQALVTSETDLTRNLPTLFIPVPDSAISVISTHLHGAVPQNPRVAILPENWAVAG